MQALKKLGTSSATPLVAGVAALMLEANPNLGYRDVMYIFAETSKNINPSDDSWVQNTAGYKHSYNYGFGMVDATAAVNKSISWTNVPALSVRSKFAHFDIFLDLRRKCN